MVNTPERRSSSFDPPEEADWHRMISQAAYYLAQRRGFQGEHDLDDWLAAEQYVRQMVLGRPARDSMHSQPESSELVSVDDTIDGIAREALAEARRVEESEKYKKNPGPLIPPDPKEKPRP
jgi:hypothetical protein